MLIKKAILDQVKGTFATQGVLTVDGTYDGTNGMLTFHFRDTVTAGVTTPGDVISCPFTWDAKNMSLDSVTGFKELLMRAGGVIIQEYNSKFPTDHTKFIQAVTEP